MFDIRERRAVRGSKNHGGSSKGMGIICPPGEDILSYLLKYGDVKLGRRSPSATYRLAWETSVGAPQRSKMRART